MSKYILLILVSTIVVSFSCNNKYSNSEQTPILCDTIQTINNEPTFLIKGFSSDQTEVLRFYLLNGSFKYRVKGYDETCQIEKDAINNIATYQFGFLGFEKTDTLVFRTDDDLFFFFTDYHYTSNNGCVLSDTITINGKQCTDATIYPNMGIPRDALDVDLMVRFYWDDMQ